MNRKEITLIISRILKNFTVIETNDIILSKALFSEICDYEDAVIDAAAQEGRVDYIITRNIEDFESGKIKAISPSEYLRLFES